MRLALALLVSCTACDAVDLSGLRFACARDDECASGTICRSSDGVCASPAELCGDGVLRAGLEGCDDGGRVDGDGCDARCAIEPGYRCVGQPSACARCGDGALGLDEACDDGGLRDGDGCSARCAIEEGWTCDSGGCRRCGNAIRERGEACDDGGSPACTACAVRFGWRCDGELGARSVCTPLHLRHVAAGLRHSCGVLEDGAITCAGLDVYPGTDTITGQLHPPSLAFEVARLALGAAHGCALGTHGELACWGADGYPTDQGWRPAGQSIVPAGLGPVTEVTAGSVHTCALDAAGAVRCWGELDQGRGQGARTPVRNISCGSFSCCGVRVADAVPACWGDGNPEIRDGPPDPVPVTALDLGSFHACAVVPHDGVRCWGREHGGRTSSVAGDFVSVGSGHYHNCALQTDGEVRCWGVQVPEPALSVARLAAPPGPFVELAVGGYHTCARRADGTVACWGDPESW